MFAKGLKQRLPGLPTDQTSRLDAMSCQLHVAIVARNPGDAGWPGPVFGLGTREPWEPGALDAFVEQLKAQL